MSNKKKPKSSAAQSKLLSASQKPLKWYYIFAFLLVYSFVVVRKCRLPSMEDVVYSFHAVDFSMGFCSRFLPGAIFNFFFREPTKTKAVIFETGLLVLFFAVLSVFLSKVSKGLSEENRPCFLLLTLFFLTGPGTFSIYSYQIGMLDVYWMFFGVAFFVVLNNRYTRWLIPFLCCLCVTVHQSAFLCYVPLMALILLSETDNSKTKGNGISLKALFIITCLVSTATFLYFAINDEKNFLYSMEDFAAILRTRGAYNCDYYEDYAKVTANLVADGILTPAQANYYSNPILLSPERFPAFAPFVNMIWKRYQLLSLLYSLDVYKKALIRQVVMLLLLLPMLAVLYKYFVFCIKETSDKLQKFIYICIIAYFPVISLLTPLISSDTVRWMSHAFTVPFVFFIYTIYKKKDTVISTVKTYTKKVPLPIIAIYLLVYAFTIFDPYIIIKAVN